LLAARFWNDTPDDNDRQRRKQAEFLVWQSLDWAQLTGIGVLTTAMKQRTRRQVPVRVLPSWYYE
jgi:ssDNA thymidine ADP-ribosyltransferase, DarT